jgi:hypothetical protein
VNEKTSSDTTATAASAVIKSEANQSWWALSSPAQGTGATGSLLAKDGPATTQSSPSVHDAYAASGEDSHVNPAEAGFHLSA